MTQQQLLRSITGSKNIYTSLAYGGESTSVKGNKNLSIIVSASFLKRVCQYLLAKVCDEHKQLASSRSIYQQKSDRLGGIHSYVACREDGVKL